MFVYGSILSPTLSGWIDCLSSDNHSSHHPTIVFYIDICLLKHKSYSVYFLHLFDHCSFAPSLLVSLASRVSFEFLPFSGSGSPVLPSSVPFVCGTNKLFNFFKALFNTAGIFRLSILFFKSPAVILTICRTVSVTSLSVLLVALEN